jgi:hypothetical membrane protein
MKRITTLSILTFAAVVLAGPAYTVDGYSAVSNLISELGAQKTKNNYIMIFGFIALGSGIVTASLKQISHPQIPFMLFGLFMVAAGVFPHKPIDPALEYNATFHSLHGASAMLAGISITIGFVWQGVLSKQTGSKLICFYLAVVCFAFPVLMLKIPEYRGLVQRLMYVQVLGWIALKYPEKIVADKTL